MSGVLRFFNPVNLDDFGGSQEVSWLLGGGY